MISFPAGLCYTDKKISGCSAKAAAGKLKLTEMRNTHGNGTARTQHGIIIIFPGLFEFYELYRVFLPLFREHREYFYDWCEIGSIYGAPADCIWGGGRAGFGENDPEEVLELMQEYGISARLTFSNSLLRQEHLSDRKCNALCRLFERNREPRNGVIIYSELLLEHLKEQYPGLYFVSSTTKVLTDFTQLEEEIRRKDFHYVVPDFRLTRLLIS